MKGRRLLRAGRCGQWGDAFISGARGGRSTRGEGRGKERAAASREREKGTGCGGDEGGGWKRVGSGGRPGQRAARVAPSATDGGWWWGGGRPAPER